MAAGRSTEPRAVTVTTISGSAAVTAPAGTFNEEDAGRSITGAGIPAGATLATYTSDGAATLSVNATAAATTTATLAGAAAPLYGFRGWSPETDAESETYTVAAVAAGATTPDRLVNARTATTQRSRS